MNAQVLAVIGAISLMDKEESGPLLEVAQQVMDILKEKGEVGMRGVSLALLCQNSGIEVPA